MTKYALLSYTTKNIGDEIQSLAAKRFLPRVDYYINRDYLNDFKPEPNDKIKIIMNGWYSHRPENFPWKSDQIEPLLTSVYFADHVKGNFSSPENIQFMKKYGPVGARSIDTKQFLESIGVESYYSGCLSLTLNSDINIKKRDFIIALDVPDQVYDKLKRESKYYVLRMNAFVTNTSLTTEQRFKLAKYYLCMYQSARMVVTTRLHGTMPCLALGTKVLNLEIPNFDVSRFKGLRELANHMTIDEYMTNGYDVNNPLENPPEYLKIRRNLENICGEFTGYNSLNSFLEGETIENFMNDPELLQIIFNGFINTYTVCGATK